MFYEEISRYKFTESQEIDKISVKLSIGKLNIISQKLEIGNTHK